MTLLWRLGEGSVNDVLAALPTGRKLAYTSVSTILRILEQKEIVSSRKEGRGHIYVPRLTKDKYEAVTVQDVVSKVFDGAPASLVKRLLDESELSEEELKAIRKLINERLS
ncbi:MAG: BlaI/MecI/CopY family transcriptional regulator [Deltaproteobacteria bacterium]|nr:BlaI/MecI/CopY family transcriptional regulator [Deltaproteobacteria bacterium]